MQDAPLLGRPLQDEGVRRTAQPDVMDTDQIQRRLPPAQPVHDVAVHIRQSTEAFYQKSGARHYTNDVCSRVKAHGQFRLKSIGFVFSCPSPINWCLPVMT
jgi:hypothetical protein